MRLRISRQHFPPPGRHRAQPEPLQLAESQHVCLVAFGPLCHGAQREGQLPMKLRMQSTGASIETARLQDTPEDWRHTPATSLPSEVRPTAGLSLRKPRRSASRLAKPCRPTPATIATRRRDSLAAPRRKSRRVPARVWFSWKAASARAAYTHGATAMRQWSSMARSHTGSRIPDRPQISWLAGRETGNRDHPEIEVNCRRRTGRPERRPRKRKR